MIVYYLRIGAHTIRFGNDARADESPMWKSDVDNTGWTPGQDNLSAELQDAVNCVLDKVLPAPKLRAPYYPYD